MKWEKERAHLDKMARLELEKVAVANRKNEPGFDLNRACAYMPVFEENAVDVFFEMFEKVALECAWPEEKCSLLVQSVLIGKAQRAVAALDVWVWSIALRKAVLEAYGSVPEAYRRQFRELRRLVFGSMAPTGSDL